MALTVLATACSAGGCPTVFAPEDGWLVIQGLEVGHDDHIASPAVPAGEQRIKISVELFLDAAAKIQGTAAG